MQGAPRHVTTHLAVAPAHTQSPTFNRMLIILGLALQLRIVGFLKRRTNERITSLSYTQCTPTHAYPKNASRGSAARPRAGKDVSESCAWTRIPSSVDAPVPGDEWAEDESVCESECMTHEAHDQRTAHCSRSRCTPANDTLIV